MTIFIFSSFNTCKSVYWGVDAAVQASWLIEGRWWGKVSWMHLFGVFCFFLPYLCQVTLMKRRCFCDHPSSHHVFPFAPHRISRCKFEAIYPLHSSSVQAHSLSEHKHESGQGKYLERRITGTESCEVYTELQVWKGHIIVAQRFSEVKDSLRRE